MIKAAQLCIHGCMEGQAIAADMLARFCAGLKLAWLRGVVRKRGRSAAPVATKAAVPLESMNQGHALTAIPVAGQACVKVTFGFRNAVV